MIDSMWVSNSVLSLLLSLLINRCKAAKSAVLCTDEDLPFSSNRGSSYYLNGNLYHFPIGNPYAPIRPVTECCALPRCPVANVSAANVPLLKSPVDCARESTQPAHSTIFMKHAEHRPAVYKTVGRPRTQAVPTLADHFKAVLSGDIAHAA